MNHRNLTGYAALAIASIALAVSIWTAVRRPDARGSGACVDQVARDGMDGVRRVLADRNARAMRVDRAPRLPDTAIGAPTAAGAPPWAPPPADAGPRRFVRFEIPNPAVTVTQKDDGTYDIHTTDPTLAGSVMVVTGITAAGDEEQLYIRVP